MRRSAGIAFISVLFSLLGVGLVTTDCEAQFLRRGSGYTQTANGYIYKGKEYIRGRDLPPNPNCPCPMCRDLVSAYYAARQQVQGLTVIPFVEGSSASTALIPTPDEAVPDMMKTFEDQFKKNPDFRLCDPGCGDAKLLIYAVQKYGIRGVGIEINPTTYNLAKQRVREAGLEDRIEIKLGDSRNFTYDKIDGMVMFLFPELISDLTKKFGMLKSGVRVVSYSHEIPLPGTLKWDDYYVWTKK